MLEWFGMIWIFVILTWNQATRTSPASRIDHQSVFFPVIPKKCTAKIICFPCLEAYVSSEMTFFPGLPELFYIIFCSESGFNWQGLSPPEVIEGYEKACKKALEILPGKPIFTFIFNIKLNFLAFLELQYLSKMLQKQSFISALIQCWFQN